jgi:hypothetical protein
MNVPGRQFDHSGLEILSHTDCHRLLRSVPIGRLVFTQGALPAVRLVNFLVAEGAILFRTSDGDKLRAAERGDVVAFEVDEIDQDRHLGWTVTAIGHLSVADTEEDPPLAGELPLRPWAPHHDGHLIRLEIESLQGRRLLAWAQRPHDN